MLSLLFVLDDTNLIDVDCRDVTQGNPGIGGTEYLFVALATEFATRSIANVTVAHFGASNRYPGVAGAVRLGGKIDSPWDLPASHYSPDFIIVRAYYNEVRMRKVIDAIPGTAPIIVWAHNHLRWATYNYLAQCERIRCVVHVGREQVALAAMAPCRRKGAFIPNGFYLPPESSPQERERRAVYVGQLAPQKGFHRLAKLWPLIRRECPDARLDVIGDGRLYGGNGPLGPMALADPAYEKRILRHLDYDPEKHGVTFHGKLGRAKFNLMYRSVLGVPNPTGFTECCPGAALELSACGNAVVGPRRWGMCDTIIDRVTGYLCDTEAEYVSRAVSLLADPVRALAMGSAGRHFVRETFGFTGVCSQWTDLFERLASGCPPAVAPDSLRGVYPFRRLRRPAGEARTRAFGALLSNVDRVHGWLLKTF